MNEFDASYISTRVPLKVQIAIPEITALPDKESVRIWDVVYNFISLVVRIVSFGITIYVAIQYYTHGNENYMTYTLACWIIPWILTLFISCEVKARDESIKMQSTQKDCCLKISWIIFLNILRYLESSKYSAKYWLARRRNQNERALKYYKKLLQADCDETFLRLFDCFLETAPQKVLQIAIYFSGKDSLTTWQGCILVNCFINMSYALSSHQKCLRLATPGKRQITFLGQIFHLIWNLALSVARILAIALLASITPQWALIFCIIHVLISGIFIHFTDGKNHKLCAYNFFTKFLFSITVGTIFLFHVIPVTEGSTKYKYMTYYAIYFLENSLCLVVYYFYTDWNIISINLYYSYAGVVIGLFILGIIFQIIYYLYFHPNITSRASNRDLMSLRNM
uniref:XK-related protein n=1 Tax=Lutzomyia longipalpis TaxID=7200 RepID=A0A7G3B184_LUTLO